MKEHKCDRHRLNAIRRDVFWWEGGLYILGPYFEPFIIPKACSLQLEPKERRQVANNDVRCFTN